MKFKDKDRQLIRETEWPAAFEKPVDLSKVSAFGINLWHEEFIKKGIMYKLLRLENLTTLKLDHRDNSIFSIVKMMIIAWDTTVEKQVP